MRESHAQTPSLAHPEPPDPAYGTNYHHPIAPSRTSRISGIVRALNRAINPPAPGTNTMSQRIQVVLSDPVAHQLRELATGADTPHSTLAAQLIQNELARATKNGHVRPPHPAAMIVNANTGDRPPWLEPYGGDPEWRQQIWRATVALHGRYPHHLEALNDKWWTDESTLEALAALTTWRAELDETHQDPRNELAFQTQLNDYAQRLHQTGGGVTKAWKPGPTPPEWASN
jgi:hypothetical protein